MTKKITFIILLISLSISTTANAKKMYRWVDEDGNTHYTDKIPPQYAKKARSELDQNGLTIDQKSAAKTQKQVMQEKEIERLRAEQQRLVDSQKARDRVLLRTFRSIDDIILARDGKLAAIDVSISVTEGNIKRKKLKLAEMQDNAANLEKQGQSVNATYLGQIRQIRDDIRMSYSSIIHKEKTKQDLVDKFAGEILRFKKLKQLTPEQMSASNADQKLKIKNIIHCPELNSCEQRWQKAEAFVRKHATTPIQILGSKIVVTKQPVKGSQLSVSMSQIRDKQGSGATLFVDIQCTSTLTGKELCESQKVTDIIQEFRHEFGPDEYLSNEEQ